MKKNDINKLIIIIIILLLLIAIELILLSTSSKVSFSNGTTDKKKSEKQVDLKAVEKRSQDEEAFTEILGYGQIKINKDYPNIYLSNSESNGVYLSYEVFCDDKILYTSELISPGKMETFDIYSCLDAGKHKLIYKINSYDLNTHEIYWSGIKQEQEVLIEK